MMADFGYFLAVDFLFLAGFPWVDLLGQMLVVAFITP